MEELLKKLEEYNPEEIERVKKAYEFASSLHEGQFRASGEPYITHPVCVASILADMHADGNTIIAGLLHDVLEDTNTTKEDIAHYFNETVASLVDGVTKFDKKDIPSREDRNVANTRKLITGMTDDVRIIIIKLADRLHNMRTLSFKPLEKQKENALETMELFVPLAYHIGAYRIKSELEDLSLYYLDNSGYKSLEEQMLKLKPENDAILEEMLGTIKRIIEDKNIPHEIKMRTKNIYGIYKRLKEGHKLSDIHDLLALKVIVDEVSNCYLTLGLIHGKYHPVNNRFKDYICNPKTNNYQSLHTTLFTPQGRLVQTQIRAFDMDKTASFGVAAFWDTEKGNAFNVMKDDMDNSQVKPFIKNALNSSDDEFLGQIKDEVLSEKVYVYTREGRVVELPIGSTVIDLAFTLGDEIGNTMVDVIVNNRHVQVDYVLQKNDHVEIITDPLSFGSRAEWIPKAHTSYAKARIIEFNRRRA